MFNNNNLFKFANNNPFKELLLNENIDNIKSLFNNILIGGKRKILLPSELSFGNIGYAPYIPIDSSVIIEINIIYLFDLEVFTIIMEYKFYFR